jgi:hypothetical protein
MKTRDLSPKPKWWQLYLTFPLLIGAFLLDSRLQLSDGGHEVVQLGSLFGEFCLVHLWLRANARALMYMDNGTFARTIRVIEIPPAEESVMDRQSRRAELLPPIEIHGVLGNTIELDFVDAKSLSVDADARRPPEELQ